MHRVAFAATVVLGCAATASAALTSSEAAMLATAARVAQDLRAVVPPDVWERARCVVVVPAAPDGTAATKASGVMSCRAGDSAWSAPVFLEFASARSASAAREERDVVLLVMNETGVQKVLEQPADLGRDGTIAPGPIGRHSDAPSAASRPADIVAYVRTKGLFAGGEVSGSLAPDATANADAYGEAATPRTILAMRGMSAPTQASALLTALGARETMVPSPGTAASSAPASQAATPPSAAGSATSASSAAPAETDIRTRIVALQQAIDRLIVDAETSTVGTSGGSGANTGDTVPVSRERLMQLRRQLDAILAALDKRP
jgi:SH3 domain-containing YSC84-like protein 1